MTLSSTLFYGGDLQSGIAIALKQSRSIACFIKDDGEESSIWETQYLTDQQTQRALNAKAVTLCIKAGSQEADYLSAYYPLAQVPSIIVIYNGQLLLDLRAGESQQAFKEALLKTLGDTPATSGSSDTVTSEAPNAQCENHVTAPSQEPVPTSLSNPTPEATDIPESRRLPDQDSTEHGVRGSVVDKQLAERRMRLEKDRQEREAAEKDEGYAKAEARKAAAIADPLSAKGKQATHAHQQRKRKAEDKRERERIMRQIEHDKIERREKEDQRKGNFGTQQVPRYTSFTLTETQQKATLTRIFALALAKLEAEGVDDDSLAGSAAAPTSDLKRTSNTASTSKYQRCALQVRLFDGSNIRQSFPSDNTLREHVRPWVDERGSIEDIPYTFKHVLNPLPNRNLSITDEELTLEQIGLSPTSTLIIIPVREYTAAYSGNQGLLNRGVSVGYNTIWAGAGMITGALGTFLGFGGRPTLRQQETSSAGQEATPNTEPASQSSSPGINIRTLHDRRGDRDSREYYNGNQLNFQPFREPEDERE